MYTSKECQSSVKMHAPDMKSLSVVHSFIVTRSPSCCSLRDKKQIAQVQGDRYNGQIRVMDRNSAEESIETFLNVLKIHKSEPTIRTIIIVLASTSIPAILALFQYSPN
jgi:hypothetical protein